MDFSLTAEHELIRESAHKFAQQEILPGLRERDREARSDRKTLEKMADQFRKQKGKLLAEA